MFFLICQRNGRLVKIENEEMNNFIIKTLNEMTQWRNNGVWIGLHDRNVRNQWQWVTIDKSKYTSRSIMALFLVKVFHAST